MSPLPELARRAREFGQYHAPVFTLKVGREDLRNKLHLDVSSVSVDRALGAAARFSFTVGNLFDLEKRAFRPELALLKLGALVEIRIGYAQQSSSVKQVGLAGLITEVSTGFQSGGVPQVTVSGYDRMILLTKQKRHETWPGSSDSAVIETLAGKYQFEKRIQATSERHATVQQDGESDFELLKKLTEHNDLEFYLDLDLASGKDVLVCRSDERTDRRSPTLDWGAGLLGFTPETNLSEQVSEVEVRSWDVRGKKEIVGIAKRGDEQGREGGQTSGGDVVALLTADTKLTLRRALRTQEEARDEARRIFNQRARQFLKGSGECIGMPELAIDSKVTIQGLGAPYSRDYYVEQVVHTLSSGGYRTTFKVRDPAL